jgi:hypothetical protein
LSSAICTLTIADDRDQGEDESGNGAVVPDDKAKRNHDHDDCRWRGDRKSPHRIPPMGMKKARCRDNSSGLSVNWRLTGRQEATECAGQL